MHIRHLLAGMGLALLLLAAPAFAWKHGAAVGGGPVVPGLVLGTYGSTTSTGWTRIGPSNNTMPSFATCPGGTNVMYVSDFLGDDNRDGSTPTFVDDFNTAQFVLSAAATPVVNDIYQTSNGVFVTVAAVPRTGSGSYTFWQMKSRSGTPATSGTLTRTSGTGPTPLTYTAMTLGIHGPVKTIAKIASSAISNGGPGPYDHENTGGSFVPNGDGTGLGTIGNWRTAGSVAASFGLRPGCPDWVLLRMGDTFIGQVFETNYNLGSDNWGIGGFSEQEPMVLSAYDESVSAVTNGPNAGSGARARPILVVPGATTTYASMQGAGNQHLFEGRPGIQPQGGSHNYIALMGIDFYSAQRNPSDGAYVGPTNVAEKPAIHVPSGGTGFLAEDVHARWFSGGFAFDVGNFDINVRRSQVDHCYGSRALGIAADDIKSSGGAIAAGFNFEENVLDLCGYTDPAFSPMSGDNRSRNAYLQWDAVFGNRRGNTSTRSGSEDIQFRAGGVIDNNFMYLGSYGFDVGHNEGDPTLTSATTVTNNVVMLPGSPSPIGIQAVGMNFLNANSTAVSGNIIAHINSSTTTVASTEYAATEAYDGGSSNLTFSSPGTGGVPGWYGCLGGPGGFTGGHGTQASTYSILIDGTGVATTYLLVEPHTDTYAVGDVLTPVANTPSINTAGTTLSNAGTGGTPGNYGYAFANPGCAPNVSDTTAQAVVGIPLTNFSGSMAGSGALGIFTIGGGGSISAYTIVGTGKAYQVGDVLTAASGNVGGTTGIRITVTAVAHLSGWGVTVATVTSQGVHGLSFTGNIVFDLGPQGLSDMGGTHDSPQPGGAGSGTANVWTPNSFCPAAQFTGVITATNNLATSGLVTGSGPIAIGQNLAGPGVTANTTIIGGSGSAWTVSPNQTAPSALMYSYTCAPTKVYVHPERTIATYAASLGLTATIDGYMTAALANAKWNWDPAKTANNGINPYIRLGFQ